MMFDKIKSNQELSPEQYKLFKKDNIINYINQLGFTKRDEYETSYAEEGEKDDEYLKVTNRVGFYGILSERG
jgi:hypothetical protein